MTDDYARTVDAAIHRSYLAEGGRHPTSIAVSLARRLHDHSITEACDDLLAGRRVVAVMGGHGTERGSAGYATIATLARRLTRGGWTLVSGGGPGAMEATHLGAWFATRPDDHLDRAIAEVLAPRPAGAQPGREYADHDWLARAMAVRRRWPIPDGDAERCLSVGVPTWLYGHEPPAPFATHLAKYFANAVREDGLLTIATGGVVFAPGSAGTVQEIFQDAAQNHYETVGFPSPMVLLGVRTWTDELPVTAVLDRLGPERRWHDLVHVTDDPDEAHEVLAAFEPPRSGRRVGHSVAQ